MNFGIAEKPRRYIDKDLDIFSAGQVCDAYRRLADIHPGSARELSLLIETLCELQGYVFSTVNEAMVAYNQDTGSAQAAAEYAKALDVNQQKQELEGKIKQTILSSPYRAQLDKERYGHYLFCLELEASIFSGDNIPLLAEDETVASEYSKVFGGILCEFDGRQQTLQQVAAALLSTDRDIRKKAWLCYNQALRDNSKKFEDIFDRLFSIRKRTAENANLPNYTKYADVLRHRYSYTEQDIEEFYRGVKTYIVPLVKKLNARKAAAISQDRLYPWDEKFSPSGDLKLDIHSERELISRTEEVFSQIDPEFLEYFRRMDKSGNLDLLTRPNKAPTGFCDTFERFESVCIFLSCTGTFDDLRMVTHESGHAFHFYKAYENNRLIKEATAGEAAELASMSMEFITLVHWNIYEPDPEKLTAIKLSFYEKFLNLMVRTVSGDDFQRRIYAMPKCAADDRANIFRQITKEYDVGIDYSGYEEYIPFQWYPIMHFFIAPFYYIEYGFAYLGAAAVYENYLKDPQKTLSEYKRFLSAGFDVNTSESYRLAGISLDISAQHVKHVAEFIQSQIDKITDFSVEA